MFTLDTEFEDRPACISQFVTAARNDPDDILTEWEIAVISHMSDYNLSAAGVEVAEHVVYVEGFHAPLTMRGDIACLRESLSEFWGDIRVPEKMENVGILNDIEYRQVTMRLVEPDSDYYAKWPMDGKLTCIAPASVMDSMFPDYPPGYEDYAPIPEYDDEECDDYSDGELHYTLIDDSTGEVIDSHYYTSISSLFDNLCDEGIYPDEVSQAYNGCVIVHCGQSTYTIDCNFCDAVYDAVASYIAD